MHLFLILCVLLLVYSFAIREREFDFISLYCVCLIFFNISTLFGVVIETYTRVYVPANDSMFFVTALVFLSAIPFLYLPQKMPLSEAKRRCELEDNISIFLILFGFLVVLIFTLPALLSASNKREVLENGGVIYALIGALPVVGAYLSYERKKWFMMLIFVLMIIGIFLLGSRRPAALLFIGVIILVIGGRRIRLLSYWKVILFSFLGIVFLILGKSLYSFILKYGIGGFILWYQNFSFEFFIRGSEFLSTPGILAAVIDSNLDVSGTHMLKSLLAIQPLPLSYFGFSSSAFNELFQGTLFPDLDYGMAYNPWAEAYAWLGYLGVLIYGTVIPFVLRKLWYAYKFSSGLIKVTFLIAGVLLLFWVHRNSLASELAYIRNAIYPLLVILFLTRSINFVLPKKKLLVINKKD
ncbi:hypothetical protein [Pseudoalteromonas piscicida]|uniref:hypothetical protein n=1 Tax=Pseudoalteromonas piscicida TaxID=43662 RepID=UPI003C7A104B